MTTVGILMHCVLSHFGIFLQFDMSTKLQEVTVQHASQSCGQSVCYFVSRGGCQIGQGWWLSLWLWCYSCLCNAGLYRARWCTGNVLARYSAEIWSTQWVTNWYNCRAGTAPVKHNHGMEGYPCPDGHLQVPWSVPNMSWRGPQENSQQSKGSGTGMDVE